MLMILVTVPGSPEKAGTVARFIAPAMQAPLDVPANGGSLTVALVTFPLGSKVTTTVACPVGPPFSRHLAASNAAVANAAFAAFGSKRSVASLGPFFSSARRAPLANISAKPAFGVVMGVPGGSSKFDRGALPGCAAESVRGGALTSADPTCGASGARAGKALIGGAGRGASSAALSPKK
jgi:hypothetical protein